MKKKWEQVEAIARWLEESEADRDDLEAALYLCLEEMSTDQIDKVFADEMQTYAYPERLAEDDEVTTKENLQDYILEELIMKVVGMIRLMFKHTNYGALDPEPMEFLQETLMTALYEESTTKILPDISAADWGLFTTVPGVEDAAAELTKSLRYILLLVNCLTSEQKSLITSYFDYFEQSFEEKA